MSICTKYAKHFNDENEDLEQEITEKKDTVKCLPQLKEINPINIHKPNPASKLWKYVPISQKNIIEILKKSTKVFKKKFGDAIYFGELEGFQRNGYGVMKYESGRIYEGRWTNDRRHEYGFELFPNGNSYQGSYQNGKAQGRGIYKWVSGEQYEGDWIFGKKEGNGTWKGKHGEIYSGEWKQGKPDGNGTFIWPNGGKYKGEWLRGKKHGFGHEIFPTKDEFIGNYKDGLADGIGKYIWKDGSSYLGNFSEGKKNGYGKWKNNSEKIPITYEGFYKNDMKEGFGKLKWGISYEYIGEFANDEKNGIGQITWENGSSYVGQWVKDKQQGFGRMKGLNGVKKEGIFDTNNYLGRAVNINNIPSMLLNDNFNIQRVKPLDFDQTLASYQMFKEFLESKIRNSNSFEKKNSPWRYKMKFKENEKSGLSLSTKYGMIKSIYNKKLIHKFFQNKIGRKASCMSSSRGFVPTNSSLSPISTAMNSTVSSKFFSPTNTMNSLKSRVANLNRNKIIVHIKKPIIPIHAINNSKGISSSYKNYRNLERYK